MIEKVANTKILKKILETNKNVVAQFTASWCGPCQTIKPHVEGLAKSHPNVYMIKVDIDEADELVEDFKPHSVPLFVAFKDQKEVKRMVGANPAQLTQFVEDLIKN